MTTETRQQPQQVQSVARAISLIASLVDHEGGLTLSELARSADLSVSTAHRLLQTLCSGDVLCRDPISERFIPGPLLIRIARSSIAQGGLAEASEILQTLTDRTRETASFGIRDGDSVLVLLAVQSPEALRFDRRPGTRLALHSSALGRVLMAFGDEDLAEEIAALKPLAATTSHTRTEPRLVLNDLRAVRYRRWALGDQEHDEGIRSIAAPILGGDHSAHAAVAIEGPTTRVSDERLESLSEAVIDAARALRHLPIAMASMPHADGNGLTERMPGTPM